MQDTNMMDLWVGKLICPLHRRWTGVETHREMAVSSIRVKKGWTEVMAEGCWGGGLADVSTIVLMCPVTPFTCPRDQKEKPSWGMGLSTTDSECMDPQLRVLGASATTPACVGPSLSWKEGSMR